MGRSAVVVAPERRFARPFRRPRAAAALLPLLALGACDGSKGSGSVVPGFSGRHPQLAAVHFGRLVDVYGLDSAGSIELYRTDVVIGPDIEDERPSGSTRADDELVYDFISSDPDTLQQRLLITRTVGSIEFDTAVDALDDQLRAVAPAAFGTGSLASPFSVVPRNGALRLTFSHDLGITEDFFVQRDATGRITGVKNTEAVQVLEILGDPNNPSGIGNFRPITSRIIPRGNQLVVDPVLLGSEGLQYGVRNNASGLPQSPDQLGANIRLAVALEGPLAIPGIRPDSSGNLTGTNNSGEQSVIRDFRSGNKLDNTPEISRGFVRDPIPLKISGQMVMYLERVEDLTATTQVVTIFKNGIDHEIDRGDVIRLVVDNSGVPAAVTDVVVDPSDDATQPAVQHVRAVVQRQFRTDENGNQIDIFKEWDPADPTKSNTFWQVSGSIPNYGTPSLDNWLVTYAPRSVLIAEYTGARLDSLGNVYSDDARYFVTFIPEPRPGPAGAVSGPNENLSPFISVIVRFTKPVDVSTVRPVDTLFLATRDLLDPAGEQEFMAQHGRGLGTPAIDPAQFVRAKYWTPHLVAARRFDESGSQTSIRLQPPMGLYLDDAMRQADEGQSFENKLFKYHVHLVGGRNGVKDLSGNAIDFQTAGLTAQSYIVIPFSLDTRSQGGTPLFEDNLVISIARRHAAIDEDEQPSYYRDDEVPTPGVFNEKSFNLPDVFGAVIHLPDGTLSARPTSRVRQVVDDINQQPPPSQESPGRHCPLTVGPETQIASRTAATKHSAPIQNPLNPYGCRLQTVWREIDMSLSRTDPQDFNLDVEQMFWAPFTELPTFYDELDRVSLFLGHAERRPEPCVGSGSSLPSLRNSGLVRSFAANYVRNMDTSGGIESQPAPHPAYVDTSMTIALNQAVREPSGTHRFLPLPTFQQPYFVWRDERVMEQGADSRHGNDTSRGQQRFAPYILSPFLTGRGRYVTRNGRTSVFNNGAWDNRRNYRLAGAGAEDFTDGLVGSIGLPLLAELLTYPDSPNLPEENPFLATGANGWQIALTVQSSRFPAFRAYSAGVLYQGNPIRVDPTSSGWTTAEGGFNPITGQTTWPEDNSLFWVMADYVKRVSVLTSGFVEILNPHRMPVSAAGLPPADPRLGPYLGRTMPANMQPRFEFDFDPPLRTLPGGTSVVPEFRGAGVIDNLTTPGIGQGPWAAVVNGYDSMATPPNEYPDEINFPLDPRKAGDAHIRKYDTRSLPSGVARNSWTYYYNNNVTEYTPDPNSLADARFTNRFAGPNETFLPQDVVYFNWRLIFENNVEAVPPVTPVIDSFFVVYRLEQR